MGGRRAVGVRRRGDVRAAGRTGMSTINDKACTEQHCPVALLESKHKPASTQLTQVAAVSEVDGQVEEVKGAAAGSKGGARR